MQTYGEIYMFLRILNLGTRRS